ncbi:MAG: DUF1858 domain-containing protein [Chloroflexi bacterium]|nr:DUF1858 domain-containing protein [Chloroflexota bacterium]
MSEGPLVHPRMTVREVLTRFPALEEVFDRHGLHGCGGPKGPQEPIGVFAIVHRVDPAALVRDLNKRLAVTAKGEGGQPASAPKARGPASGPAARRERPVYRPFIIASLAIALTMGFTTGAALLLAPLFRLPGGTWWTTHAQGHGVAQLFGWAGLFTMGVAYHVVPRFRNTRLALPRLAPLSLALVLAGIVLRQITQGLSSMPWAAALLVVSGVCLLLGMAAFAASLGLTLRQGQRAHEPFEPWLVAGCTWALVAAALGLAVVVHIATTGTVIAPASLDIPFVHAALLGFLGNFIIGTSARIIPAFMRLGSPRPSLLAIALGLFNGGLLWQVAAWLTDVTSPWWAGGAVTQAVGMLLVIVALGVFSRRRRPVEYGPGTYRGYERYVRAAYTWWLVAAALWLYLALVTLSDWSAPFQAPFTMVRHVVALGVVTMMVLGIGSRVLPVFEGAQLQAPRLMDAAFILLNLSVALRLAFSVASTGASQAMLGVSGVAGLAALALFTIVVWRTFRPSAREGYRQSALLFLHDRLAASRRQTATALVMANSIVAEVLDRWPQTLSVFLRHNFTPLQDERLRNTVARSTTIAEACRFMGVDVEKLLAELNSAAGFPAAAMRDNPRETPS